jgi:hypothetical protein
MSRMNGRFVPRALLFCSALVIGLAVFAAGVDATDRDHDRGRGSSSHHGDDKHHRHSGHHDWDDDDDHDCSSRTKCGGIRLTGAIFTTDATGQAVNKNRYDAAKDVFLSGGPEKAESGSKNQKSSQYSKKNDRKGKKSADRHDSKGRKNDDHSGQPASLPDGWYYFQVTDPSGKVLLTTDDVSQRQFYIENGVVTAAYGRLSLQTGEGLVVQLYPFDQTPNRGNKYKLWVTPQTTYESLGGFVTSCSKTDNFKVLNYEGGGGGGGTLTATIKGKVFEDRTQSAPPLGDVPVDLFMQGNPTPLQNVTTPQNGTYQFTEQPPTLGTTYLVAPRLITTARGPLAYGPTTPPVREATITTNGQIVGEQDFGLIVVQPDTLVSLGGSGGNINFTPAYFAGSAFGTGSQGEYILQAYFSQNSTQLPAFLSAPILTNPACPAQGPLTTTEEVVNFLIKNADIRAPIPGEESPLPRTPIACQMAALWLGLNLGIATNGTSGVDSAAGLEYLYPGTSTKDYGVVHSISGGETLCWNCDTGTSSVSGTENIFGTVNTLLTEAAQCSASGFVAPCLDPADYVKALQQGAQGYLGSTFLQGVDIPSTEF